MIPRIRSPAAGFTLLELLLALTLLAGLVVASATWLSHLGALARRATRREEALAEALAAVRLLRADRAGAVDRSGSNLRSADERHALVETTHQVPGDDRVGFREIAWESDGKSGTRRRSPEGTRLVTARVALRIVREDRDGSGAWWCVAETTTSDEAPAEFLGRFRIDP